MFLLCSIWPAGCRHMKSLFWNSLAEPHASCTIENCQKYRYLSGRSMLPNFCFNFHEMWPNSENGWECKPNGEKLYNLPKLKMHPRRQFCHFQITDQVTKAYLIAYIWKTMANTCYTLFSFVSECSQDLLMQNQDDFRWHHLQVWLMSWQYLTYHIQRSAS